MFPPSFRFLGRPLPCDSEFPTTDSINRAIDVWMKCACQKQIPTIDKQKINRSATSAQCPIVFKKSKSFFKEQTIIITIHQRNFEGGSWVFRRLSNPRVIRPFLLANLFPITQRELPTCALFAVFYAIFPS